VTAEIPALLAGCRFIRLAPKSKKPAEGQQGHFESDACNYAHDDPALLAHIAAGGNYGVIPRNGVCVIDCDTPALWATIPARWQVSFTVKSGRKDGGKHLYLKCDNATPVKITFGERGDLRTSGHNSYVVGPGSIHPDTGAEYRHVTGTRLVSVSWTDLKAWADANGGIEKKPESSDTKAPQWAHIHTGGQSIGDKLGLDVSTFLMPEGATHRDGEIEGAHPVHGSTTGSNLTISADDQKWWCRRHGTGGGPLEALAVAEGIVDCDDVRAGCLDGHWAEVFSALRTRGYDTRVLDDDTGAVAAAGLLAGTDGTGGVGEGDGESRDCRVVSRAYSETDSTEFDNVGILVNLGMSSEATDMPHENSNTPGKDTYNTSNSDGGNPPVSFDEWPRPAFPLAALPPWVKDYAAALAEEMQTPVDLPAMLALSACAVAVAKKAAVAPTRTRREPLNLYVAVVMPPASRKSPVLSRIAAPIEDFEIAAAAAMKDEIRKAEVKRGAIEARISKKKRDCANATADKFGALTAELDELTAELEATPVPQPPRFLADDCTPEKLINLMADNGGKMAVLSAEANVFDIMGGRYSDGRANLGVYLQAHAAEPIKVDRVGRSKDHIREAALTLGLAIQPSVLMGLGKNQKMTGRGLCERFLFSIPADNIGYRSVNGPPAPDMVEFGYRNCLTALLDLDTGGQTYALTLAPGAHSAFVAFAQSVEDRLKPGSESGLKSVQEWAGKLVGAMLRIAGVLHMATHAGRGNAWMNPIQAETMQAAVEIAEYLIPHAKMAFGVMQADEELESAKYLWKRVCQDGRQTLTKQEIWQACRGRFKRTEALDVALGILVDRGYLTQTIKPATGPGRKPAPVYHRNPAAPLLSGGAV